MPEWRVTFKYGYCILGETLVSWPYPQAGDQGCKDPGCRRNGLGGLRGALLQNRGHSLEGGERREVGK